MEEANNEDIVVHLLPTIAHFIQNLAEIQWICKLDFGKDYTSIESTYYLYWKYLLPLLKVPTASIESTYYLYWKYLIYLLPLLKVP